MELLLKLLPSAGTIVAVVIALALVDRLLQRASKGAQRLRNQLVMLALTAIGILIIILTLPIGDTMRGQILSLIGILLTAAIALSSTTFLGNALAGIMLNAVRSFRIGDFIEINDHFGRVTERGLFHTEIQTRERDLITLPNLYLVTHPVRTVRTSGTIISAEVSLGYDVPRREIERNLILGAENAELKEPFVQIGALGDFSVTYRVAGMLEDVKQIVTAPSRLRAKVLDALHDAGIEIVSPTFMNQRVFSVESKFVPAASDTHEEGHDAGASDAAGGKAESLAFDKAEEAESIASLAKREEELQKQIFESEENAKKAPDDQKEALTAEIEKLKARRERLAGLIEKRKQTLEDEE